MRSRRSRLQRSARISNAGATVLVYSLQDVTDRSGSWPAQRLDQGGLCVRAVVRARLAAQLGHRLDSLVHACRAPGEATRLHTSHGCRGDPAPQTDLALRGKRPAFAPDGKANCFALQRRVNAEDV